MPRSIRRARHVIVPTDAVRAAVVRRCLAPPNKISVIHEGVRDLFRRQADPVVVNRVRESFGITGRVLLFVGNLEPKKNLQTLLAALELAKGHIPDLQLVLCGRMGWRTHAIQHALHRMRSPSDVILTGYVSTPILHALYALAEVFVFPSIIEGFGVPPLEAMACGTPVVVSNDAAISEVVGNSAIQVNPSDAPELATAIVSVLLSRDLRDELRERGLERSRCFTWAKTASETVAVYKDVCRQA
jgi:glycosyltransferase involved in cell wall biosynthesis